MEATTFSTREHEMEAYYPLLGKFIDAFAKCESIFRSHVNLYLQEYAKPTILPGSTLVKTVAGELGFEETLDILARFLKIEHVERPIEPPLTPEDIADMKWRKDELSRIRKHLKHIQWIRNRIVHGARSGFGTPAAAFLITHWSKDITKMAILTHNNLEEMTSDLRSIMEYSNWVMQPRWYYGDDKHAGITLASWMSTHPRAHWAFDPSSIPVSEVAPSGVIGETKPLTKL